MQEWTHPAVGFQCIPVPWLPGAGLKWGRDGDRTGECEICECPRIKVIQQKLIIKIITHLLCLSHLINYRFNVPERCGSVLGAISSLNSPETPSESITKPTSSPAQISPSPISLPCFAAGYVWGFCFLFLLLSASFFQLRLTG